MTLEIRIATGSSTPIYGQIVNQICKAVATGELQPGHQMPSVRALAEQLVVNPNTIARAYGDLVRDGVLDSQRGKGLFVAEQRIIYSEEERLRRLDQALETFVDAVRLLGFTPAEVQNKLSEKLTEAPVLMETTK